MRARCYLTGMNTNLLENIPLSPMRFKRCGECGCAAHKGHSTACSRYNHSNQKFIETKTQELVKSLKIEEQVRGLSTHATLVNISIRLSRLSSAAAKVAVVDCQNLAAMALKYGCA